MAFKISDYYNQYKDYYGDASLEDVAKDIYDRGGHANQYKDFETFKKTTGMDSEIQADNEKRRPKSFMDKLSEGVASVAPGLEEIPKGLSAGVQQVRGMGYGLGALAGEVTGSEGLKKWGAEGLKDVEAKTPKAAVGSFSEIENISDLGKYLAYGVSSNLPNMAISLATGGVGGLAGKTLAKGAIEKSTAGIVEKEVAKKVAQDIAKKYLTRGAVAGAATSSIGMEAGSIAGDQLNETGKVDPLRAMAGAIPAGLLDVVPEWYLAKKLGWIGKGAHEFNGNLPTRIAKVAGAQFAMEAPTEAVQSAIERASVPGKSITNAEAWDEYINSFILGGVTGGVVGAAGGVFAKGEQQKETREAKKTALSNTIDEGLKNGNLGEEEFTPSKALGIIKSGLDEGIFSADDISEFRKYEKDHPEFKTGLDTISNHAAKNELNMVVDSGIKNGNIGGVDVTPDDILKIIAEYHGKGLYTDDDLTNFKEQYPILKTGLNDVLVESAKKKVNDDVPLYLGPEDAAEQSARAREAFTNAAGQRLLPPGQGFTFKDVDYGIPVGEPYGEADFIDVPSVSREIRGLPHAEPVKQLPPGQGFELGGASDIAYPDEFTRKLAEAPEIKAVAPMASIGQESEGSAGASGIEPGGNLEKAPHSLTYTAVKGNSIFNNVMPENVEQLRSMGYEITENKPAIADVPGAQTVAHSPVTEEEAPTNTTLESAKLPAEQQIAERPEATPTNLAGAGEIVQPRASSQEAPETRANKGIAEGKLSKSTKQGNLHKLEPKIFNDSALWQDDTNRIEYELNAPGTSANPSTYWEGGVRHKGWAQEAQRFATREEAIQWLDNYDTSKINKNNWGPGEQFIDEMFGKGSYKKVKGQISTDNEAKVKDAIADAKKNGPSNEFRSLFGGIEPAKAGTTNEAVAALAKELGLKWESTPAPETQKTGKEAALATNKESLTVGKTAPEAVVKAPEVDEDVTFKRDTDLYTVTALEDRLKSIKARIDKEEKSETRGHRPSDHDKKTARIAKLNERRDVVAKRIMDAKAGRLVAPPPKQIKPAKPTAQERHNDLVKQDQKYYDNSPAKKFIDSVLSDINLYNKTALAKYLDGTEKEFNGLVDRKWLLPLDAMGIPGSLKTPDTTRKDIAAFINAKYNTAKETTPEPTETLIRLAEKKDLGKASKSLAAIPDKAGYEKVYKKDGKEGRGFYYVKKAEKESPAFAEDIENLGTIVPIQPTTDGVTAVGKPASPAIKQKDKREAAINKYIEHAKKHMSEDMAKAQAEKWTKAIDDKDYKALRNIMNGINPQVNRLFTALTGLPAKTQKEADASLRSFDPAGWDKWQGEKTETREKEAAERDTRYKQQEIDNLLDKQVRIEGGEVMTYRERYRRLIDEEGFSKIREEKRGVATIYELVNEEGVFVKIPKKILVPYVQDLIDKKKTAAKQGSKAETEEPSKAANSLTPTEYKNKIIELTLKNAAPYMGNLDNSESGILQMLKSEVDNSTGKILNDFVIEEKGDISEELANYINSMDKEALAEEVLEQAKKTGIRPLPAPDLSQKSTGELVSDIFAIINNHVGSRGSISNRKIAVEESLYQKLKPYLKEIVGRAKAKALDVKAYLFGAVDSMPNSTAKAVYEAAAERYIEEDKALPQKEDGVIIEEPEKEVEENALISDGKQTAGTPEDDRGSLAGESTESVSGIEEGKETSSIPEGEGSSDDGELRSGVGSRDESTGGKRLHEEGAANNRNGKKGVGGNNGDISGLQRFRNHRIEPGSIKREGGWKATAKTNLDIIELVKKLEAEGRQATPEEQNLLAKYTGWGASEIANNLFPGYAQYGEIRPDWAKPEWKPLAERLVNLLTPEEIKTAAKSTQYAHYTSEAIIRSIYKALDRFGFNGGKILEPGMGVGSFAGLIPENIVKGSSYTGIEMDGITAKIAKYLYPGHNVLHGDYTAQAFPNNFFDLGVGNPPFSQTVILSDPAYKKNRFKLHDYFFAKTIDKVRPGGLLVFITSRYTMDKQDNRARRYLAERADLLGAIRLPQTAFQQNAGTEVVTDVLFLRKKTDGEETTGQAWDKLAEVTTPEGPAMINEYFAEHPEMVLGKNSLQGSMYGANQYTVIPEKGTDIEEQFAAATENLPQNVYSIVKKSPKEQEKAVVERDFNPKNKKEGGLYISDDGTIMENTYGSGVPLSSTRKVSDNDQKWLKDYIALRDAVKQCQYDQLTDGPWEKSLKALQKEYKSFVKKNGRVQHFTITERKSVDEDGNEQVYESRRFKNDRLLKMDVEHPLVLSTESINENGEVIESPFLSDRTIGKPVTAEIKTTADALAVTLDETGKLDVEAIAQRMGRSVNEVVEELGDLIYEEPGRDGYVLADEYLSGEVVKKLDEAMSASRLDLKYKRNVEALKAVQPEPLKPADITVVLGANWVPQEVYNDFTTEVLGLKNTSVNYDPRNNTWSLGAATENTPSWGRRKKKNAYRQQSMRGATNDWGTNDRGPNEILESILNNSTIKITRTEKVGDTTRTYTDMEATTAANEIAKRMRQRFNSWIWEDAERAGEMLDLYNRRYNTIAGRKFDGSHLTLPGVSLLRKLYDHQKRAIWRIIQSGNTYLNHAVGAGKTYSMIAAGMEMRRLGLVKKPLYVVPKHMLQQFANEFMELYPMANIMVADEENFHTTNRRRFIAQASLNNPDAIIITHPSFGKLKMKEESIAPVRDAFLQELRDSLQDMEDDDAPRHKIKQMEKRIEQAEQRFANMVGGAGKDNVVTFEEMGVDFLFVDEAHQFRKLDFTTNRQAKGIDPNGSIMAMDLYIKSLWLESQNKGRSHCFASGTPIVNTMGELYTIMRFFNEKQMEEDGIRYFDSWANMFGQMAQGMEMNAAGRYELVERFAEFVNIPELMSRVRMFMDILTSSQLGGFVKRPEIKGGKAEIVVAPPSEGLKAYQKDVLQPRIEQSKLFKPSPEQPGNPDPLINIITDGRLASIDLRYVVRGAVNDPTSKLNRYIDGIIQSYKETKDKKYLDLETGKASPIKGGAIICFYNHGFGKSVAQRRGFDARKWLMHRLKEAKIPASEVAWIDDYDTAVKKEAMFKEVRQGTKRILIGSAKKMGTGMNVQRRLAALHYLDPPWYPADVEQPDGRIIRQGNQNDVVDLKRYATKGSYDSSMWQMVARKSKLMEQAYIGDASVRKIQDLSESSQYEMAAALSSGDERVIRLVGLKAEAETLHRLRGAHQQAQRRLYYDRQNRQYDIESTEKQIKKLQEAEAKVPDHVISISGKIGKKEYDKREDFGAEVIKAYNEALNNKNNSPGVSRKIATLNDIPLTLRCVKQSYAQKDDNLSYTALLTLDVTEDVRFSVAEGGPFVIEDGDGKALITKAVNNLNRISTLRAKQESNLRDHNDEMKKIKARLGAPFESEQELNEKIAEIAQLEKELLEEGEEVNTGKDEVFDGSHETWKEIAYKDLEDIDPEDEEYTIALAQSARAQALLSQYGKGSIESALQSLKLAKDNWAEFHEGEPEPKEIDLAQTVIRSIDSGQGRLFKGAQYSRRASGVRGISTARIQSIVDKVTSTLKINPKINAVQHVSECPDAVLKDMERNGILDENGDADVQGFAWRGETWLVGDNLDSDVEAFKVLMHELTHNGLGALLNDNSNLKSVQWQYNNLMDKIISAHRRDIMTIARTTHTHLNLNTIEGRRQAAEEWLCNQSYEAQHKWYDKLITIFNNLVRAMGLDIKLSDSEVRIILREAFQTFEGRNDDVRYMVAAWHGSRGLFNQFSSQKVKTGSFGHGLYFSSMREIAEQYKEGGHLYKVTLAPDESDFLDWDAPINKQSKYVQDVLNNSAIRDNLDAYEDAGGYVDTGKDVYLALMREQGGAQAASQLLSDYGIPGNKYIDSSQGKGGQNYVLFDDQNVNIEARYARKDKTKISEFKKLSHEAALLERQVDNAYENDDPRAEELDAQLTILKDKIEGIAHEYESESFAVDEGVSLEEELANAYHTMIVQNFVGYSKEEAINNFRAALANRGANINKATDVEILAAAKDAYDQRKAIIDRYNGNAIRYSIRKPQGPPTGKGPIIKQREIGKGEEKRTAPAVHQSDFETVQAMPELRVKPLGGWLENPIRTFEELGKDVKELFYRPVKEAEHQAKIEFKAIHEQVEKLRKSLPGKSSERIGIYALAQQKDGQEILKSMKITEVPKLDTKEMEAYEWMRENLEEFYEKLQTAREAAGKEGFGKVENYFTFARQFSLAEKLGFSPIFTRSELLNTVMHRKTTSFKYEKHRSGGMSRADLDAFGVFNRYMESATRHVALSPAIAKGREMLLTFKAPGPDGEETNWLLRDEKPAAAKFITEWLDFQAGQRKPQLPNLIEKGLTTLNKNLAFAILSANIRSALIQPSAIVNTFTEIGPKWTFEGIKGIMDDSIINKSNVLLSRQFDVNISETMAGLPGRFGRVKQAIGNIGMKPLQFLDMMTARATWQGAYKKALSEGMEETTAVNYADDVVTKTQGSAMPSDMAPVQRTALGKSVTMFQTFVINQWGFLTKDVLGINNAQISKKDAARKILTFVAFAILFNMFYEDLLEVPAPLPSPISAFVKALDKGESMPSASADAAREIASIVPIIGGGLRYGSSPFGAPVEYVTDIFKKMSPNYSGPTRSAPELIGKGLGIPGTTQATKIARVEKKGGSLLDMALGRYDTENDPRQIKKSLVRRLRNKDAPVLADMRKYYQEGKLTKKEIKAIRDEASVPEIVWKFKRLPLDEAIEEYKSASAEEKKLLRPVLKSKMHLLSELAPEPRKKKVMELKEALVS